MGLVRHMPVVMPKEGLFPGIHYPRVPGHGVAGIIDMTGKGIME
jgi:D-arabinose 1-dehydrogenase-like Zn-dependent alcohol dehydrogenase